MDSRSSADHRRLIAAFFIRRGGRVTYILARRPGTTSSRAIVFDHAAMSWFGAAGVSARSPQTSWVEHERERDLGHTAAHGVGGDRPKQAHGCRHRPPSDQNQRETTVVWDRDTGEPIHHAIVWQDRRTAAACDRLKARSSSR